MVGERVRRSNFETSNSVKAAKCVCVLGLRVKAFGAELEEEMNTKEMDHDEECCERILKIFFYSGKICCI